MGSPGPGLPGPRGLHWWRWPRPVECGGASPSGGAEGPLERRPCIYTRPAPPTAGAPETDRHSSGCRRCRLTDRASISCARSHGSTGSFFRDAPPSTTMTTPIRWASIHFSRYDTCFSVAVVCSAGDRRCLAQRLSVDDRRNGRRESGRCGDHDRGQGQAGSREASHRDAGRRRDESPYGSSDWGRNVRCLAGPSCRTHQDCEGRPRRAK